MKILDKFSFLLKRIIFLFFFLLILVTSLFALNITTEGGFSVPIGTWADCHNPGPFISIGAQCIKTDFASLQLYLALSTFPGKLNDSYHLQMVSPGIGIKFYPFFFRKNHFFFLEGVILHNFMEKKIHSVVEEGSDFGILSTIGGQFNVSENWIISPYIGEHHIAGGIDMITFGLRLGFQK